jgi:hypothetical protein
MNMQSRGPMKTGEPGLGLKSVLAARGGGKLLATWIWWCAGTQEGAKRNDGEEGVLLTYNLLYVYLV